MLARAADDDAREGDWLVAETQAAGRGRQGREWMSPPGNLYASGMVAIRPTDPSPPTLALVAGIAVVDALNVSGLKLKWPNDVVHEISFAKVSGILLERTSKNVVVGVGVNLMHYPNLPYRPTTSLAALGGAITVDQAIGSLIATFARWLDIWRTYGLAPVRAAWLERAYPVGTSLLAELPDGSRLAGGFDGLTEDCALRLRLADGRCHVIHAGDVFLV